MLPRALYCPTSEIRSNCAVRPNLEVSGSLSKPLLFIRRWSVCHFQIDWWMPVYLLYIHYLYHAQSIALHVTKLQIDIHRTLRSLHDVDLVDLQWIKRYEIQITSAALQPFRIHGNHFCQAARVTIVTSWQIRSYDNYLPKRIYDGLDLHTITHIGANLRYLAASEEPITQNRRNCSTMDWRGSIIIVLTTGGINLREVHERWWHRILDISL